MAHVLRSWEAAFDFILRGFILLLQIGMPAIESAALCFASWLLSLSYRVPATRELIYCILRIGGILYSVLLASSFGS
jgi:hypothetical protein